MVKEKGRIDILFANAGVGELVSLGAITRVNVISPGPIDTPMFNNVAHSKEQTEQLLTNIVSTVPVGRMGSPKEVANAALFLALDDSSYVTGIELFVDGSVAHI